MKNKIYDELQKIEIPVELHDRAKLGVKRAKKEQQKRRFPMFVAVSAIIAGFVTVSFAFPSIASQIPFMDNVIQFFSDEDRNYQNFSTFSTEIGLTQTSNGTTVMIDQAVYDGTNITISYAIETEQAIKDESEVYPSQRFDVVGATGIGGSEKVMKISDNRYVGLATLTPYFEDDTYPESVEISWQPERFVDTLNDIELSGDWAFTFSLDRIESDIQLLNQTVQNEEISFTLRSIEFTNVSTVIHYEQIVSDKLLDKWESVTPSFHITDDQGNVYMDGTGGGGMSVDNGKTFKGSIDFGTMKEGASKLIINPIIVASHNFGRGHIEIELDPIVIDLEK